MSTLIAAMVKEHERLMRRHEAFEGVLSSDGHWIWNAGCELYSGAMELMEAVSCVEAKTADDAIAQLASLAEAIRDLNENEHSEINESMLLRRIRRLLYSIQGFLAPQAQTMMEADAVRYLMAAYSNPWSTPDALKAAHEKPSPFEEEKAGEKQPADGAA